MELEEFERLNPIICDKCEGFGSKKEAIMVQAQYLKTHTFILESLNEQQVQVLRLRYGIDDEFLSLRQIANKLGITGERVRQIEEIAFEKLRHPIRIKWLMEYTDETFDNTLLEEIINLKSLIRKDIIRTINEDTLQIVQNISINELEIKSGHSASIKSKLKKGGIETCADLIKYLQTHSNLNELAMGWETHNKLISSICELIENGIITITSQQNLTRYLDHKAGYDRKEHKKQMARLKDENERKTRLANWSENLDQVSIKDFKFSSRTANCLERTEIHTLQDLIDYYSIYGNFSGITNLGVKCEQEIYDKMQKLGLNLHDYLLQNRSNVLNNAMQNPENVLIENLELSDRAYNSLKRAGINTLQDLINYYSTYKTLCRIQRLGTKLQNEILDKLTSLGINWDEFLEENSNNSNLKD